MLFDVLSTQVTGGVTIVVRVPGPGHWRGWRRGGGQCGQCLAHGSQSSLMHRGTAGGDLQSMMEHDAKEDLSSGSGKLKEGLNPVNLTATGTLAATACKGERAVSHLVVHGQHHSTLDRALHLVHGTLDKRQMHQLNSVDVIISAATASQSRQAAQAGACGYMYAPARRLLPGSRPAPHNAQERSSHHSLRRLSCLGDARTCIADD